MAHAKSKFAGLFEKPPVPEPEPPTEPEPLSEPPPLTSSTAPAWQPAPVRSPRPVGRPPGKRSDPAWKQFSVLLRRDTQREAMLILRREEHGQDLSGLVQTLLEEWVRSNKGKQP